MSDESMTFENTMRALLLVSLKGLDASSQVETLLRAGFSNADAAKLTGLTPKAVERRRARLKERGAI
jgi:hypothetical protein